MRILPVMLVALVAAPAVRADDSDPPDVDPVELIAASAEFLASQPAFAFDWVMSFDEIVDGREKITFVRSGQTTMSRSGGFRVTTDRGDSYRDYYFDGQTFTISGPDEGFYASAPFDGGFDELVEAARARTGSILPLWTIMSETLPARLTADIEGAAHLGLTRIGGVASHHIAVTGYDEDWQVWISDDPGQPVPTMLVGTDTAVQGWPQYRVFFFNWDLAPEIVDGGFTFVADPEATPVAMPSLDLAGGTRPWAGTAGDAPSDDGAVEPDAGAADTPNPEGAGTGGEGQ